MFYVSIAPPCLEGILARPDAEQPFVLVTPVRVLRTDEPTISAPRWGRCGKLADVDASLRGKVFD